MVITTALRKTKQLRIRNLRFLNGDILASAVLGGPFDMIQSVGVLHHMKTPVAGWKILSRLLRVGGVFKGGLYCERGRQGVFAARRAIASEKLTADREGIATFRRRILRGEIAGDFSKLMRLADFFSASNCRDLMFHVHEDNYTPLRLKDEIAAVGLTFLGFNEFEAPGLNADYRSRFPDEPTLIKLDNWEALEREHGLQPLLLGGPSRMDREMADRIIHLTSARPLDLVGNDLRRLVWLLDGSALVVSPDTGPLHIARALDVPVVGLYGYTNPKRSGPYKRYQDLVVDGYAEFPGEAYPVMPAYRDGMKRVTVEAVLEKISLARKQYPR